MHLYENNELDWKLEDGTPLSVRVATRYPWEGTVDMTVNPGQAHEFTLFLRIPGWARSAKIAVNGKPEAANPVPGRYAAIKRRWQPGNTVKLELEMTPQVLTANPLVKENQGRVAIRRGPVVYCLEQVDQAAGTPVLEAAFRLTDNPGRDFVPDFRKDLLGGVVVLKHRGVVPPKPFDLLPLYRPLESGSTSAGKAAGLVLIPYYGFANRGPAAMQVWTSYVR